MTDTATRGMILPLQSRLLLQRMIRLWIRHLTMHSMDAPIMTTPNGEMTMILVTTQAQRQLVKLHAVEMNGMALLALASTEMETASRDSKMVFHTLGLEQSICARS